MLFSKSFLPSTPARWSLLNATIEDGIIEIQPGGSASVRLTEEDTPIVHSTMRLVMNAIPFSDPSEPADFVKINVLTMEDLRFNVLCPIIHVDKDVYMSNINLMNTEYKSFVFTIQSVAGVRLTQWEFSAPAGENTDAIINELKSELPRLLYDYNKAPFAVKQKETTIALISAYLHKNTDLNGHIQFKYNASEDTQLIVRAKTNEINELFTPIIYNLKKGRGSIGIPHAYVEKKVGYITFVITAQVTHGQLSLGTRDVVYTIDGGHVASRVMDVGMAVSDVTVKRTSEDYTPSYIYAAGIDAGEALVRTLPVDSLASLAWEPKGNFGPALDVAVEFDGIYNKSPDSRYAFKTDEEPWVFWIDLENVLWAQRIGDEDTMRILATNAIKLHAIKGYSNSRHKQNDQGLIVAYIKDDGLVYYRNYCYNEEGVAWENEHTMTQFTGVASDIKLFRTNDYRVGFNILDGNSNVKTLLTNRNWVGIALADPKFKVTATAALTFIKILYHKATETELFIIEPYIALGFLYGAPFNKFKLIENRVDVNGDYGLEIYATTQYRITELNFQDFHIVDSSGVCYKASNITEVVHEINNWTYRIEMSNFNNAVGMCTLYFNALYGKNEAGTTLDPFEGVFIPEGLVPLAIAAPEVEAIWNE